MKTVKYLVWKYYLRQQTGWIGTHIAAGPRITLTMIVAGLVQWYTGFYYTPWYEVFIWVTLGLQLWLSFPFFGLGFSELFPITPQEETEYKNRLHE